MKFVQDVFELEFKQKKSTVAVFIDLKDTYGIVWRNKLITKLKLNGVRGNMLHWIYMEWVKEQWDGIQSEYE